jgi:hypothetical protein
MTPFPAEMRTRRTAWFIDAKPIFMIREQGIRP